jgi:hypothetical protein
MSINKLDNFQNFLQEAGWYLYFITLSKYIQFCIFSEEYNKLECASIISKAEQPSIFCVKVKMYLNDSAQIVLPLYIKQLSTPESYKNIILI